MRFIGFAMAAIENADIEAVIGHDAARGAGWIVGRLDRSSMGLGLPGALIGPEGDARAENLDEGKTRVTHRFDDGAGRALDITGKLAGNEICPRRQRDDQGMERTEAGAARRQGAESQSGSVVGDGWPLVMP